MAQEPPPAQPPPNKRTIAFVTRRNNKPVTYSVTDDDFLTLARAVEFEGPPQNIVAWTLLQRFGFLYPIYPTLAQFVKAYAQPINPQWFPDGTAHKNWLAKLRAANRTAEADREILDATKRVTMAATPAAKISKRTYQVLAAVFAGGESPCPGSVHYRAPTVRTKDIAVAAKARADFAAAKNMLDSIKLGDPRTENWFFSEPGALTFRIQLIAQSAVVVLLLLASVAYVFYTTRV